MSVDLRPGGSFVFQLRRPALERHDTLKRRVPPRLELARDMALGGIDVLVAALGEGRVVPRLLELALNGPANILDRSIGLIGGEHRRLEGAFGDGLHDLPGEHLVDANSSDTNAEAGTDMPSSPRHW